MSVSNRRRRSMNSSCSSSRRLHVEEQTDAGQQNTAVVVVVVACTWLNCDVTILPSRHDNIIITRGNKPRVMRVVLLFFSAHNAVSVSRLEAIDKHESQTSRDRWRIKYRCDRFSRVTNNGFVVSS